jgi:hypothetical protein
VPFDEEHAWYVGMKYSTRGLLFREHVEEKGQAAKRVTHAIFSSCSYVNNLSVGLLIKLYKARIDPHLTHGSDVVVDVSEPDIAPLEHAQRRFLRRMLMANSHSIKALLLSESGILPIRHRRLVLALKGARYYSSCEPGSYPRLAFEQAVALAGAGHTSWAGLLIQALRRVMVEVPRMGVVSLFCTESINRLICEVTAAGYRSAAAGVLSTVRVPLLAPRARWLLEKTSAERVADQSTPMRVRPATYLTQVTHPPHRAALLKMMIAEHGLAIEMGRRMKTKYPRELRLCRSPDMWMRSGG